VSPKFKHITPHAFPKHIKPPEENEGALPAVPGPAGADTSTQSAPAGPSSAVTGGLSFDGISDGMTSTTDTVFEVNYAPPDTDGDIGPDHYVQIVNSSIAVFDRDGGLLLGPEPTTTLFSGFGGGCEANDDGDGIVKYDKAADRWVITEFSVSTKPYLECVAVSTSANPLGTWYRYAFSYSKFPDYPKLSVWPDAYYITFNTFGSSGKSFSGVQSCAYDRSAMLNGTAATQQCFQHSSSQGSEFAVEDQEDR
jgi:hypothetical protein